MSTAAFLAGLKVARDAHRVSAGFYREVEQIANRAEALLEVHEYHCGCDTPGQLDRCVAQPVAAFAVLAEQEKEQEQ